MANTPNLGITLIDGLVDVNDWRDINRGWEEIDAAVGEGYQPVPPEGEGGYLTVAAGDDRYQLATARGQPDGYAPLDGAGLIPSTHLPPLAISETFVVASEAEQLGLDCQVGDVAIRSDLDQTFILGAEPASTLANWYLLGGTVTGVSSVNGQTGTVLLDAEDVGALDQATADGLYATVDHTHPSEQSSPWRFQDTAGGAPGAGYLRTNTGALATATTLIISRTTQDGYDIPPPGWGVQADDTIYIQDRDDSTKWVRYRALEPLVRFPTYATGLVAVTGSAGGTIVNGQIIQVTFSLAGGGGGGGTGGVTTDALWDAKGDLAVGTGADAAGRLAVGSNGQLLSADSAQATGLAWVANPVTAHAAVPDAHHARAHDHTAADGSGALSNEEHDGYSQYANLGADPATPSTNQIRLYAKDNGSGIATLYYRTESGEIYELPTLTSGGGGGSGAPANATYITTTAENKLSQERVLGTAVIMSGTLASRPAFGTAGRLYLATDTDVVTRDTGSAWETFATRAAGLPTTGGTMTGTIAAQGAAVDTGGALVVTSPATPATDILAYGPSSPTWSPIAGGGSTDEQGLAFSTPAGTYLVAVRWYCRSAGMQIPTGVRLWDSTATATPVWSSGPPAEWTNSTVGWKEHRLAAGTQPALVAARTYVIAYGGGSASSSTTQTPYVPVPNAGMTFIEHRQAANAGTYPAAVVTSAYAIDPVVRTTLAGSDPAEAGAIRLPNGAAGLVAWRNATDTADLTLGMDSSDRPALTVTASALTTSATGGSATALPGQPVAYLTVVVNAQVRKLALYG